MSGKIRIIFRTPLGNRRSTCVYGRMRSPEGAIVLSRVLWRGVSWKITFFAARCRSFLGPRDTLI